MARLIQQTVGGDLFRIENVQDYPLKHDKLVDFAAEEQKDNARPELSSHVEDFSRYEYVFLGYPNWWGDMPQPVYTFLEEYDFGAKNIIPFITHGGSGASQTIREISFTDSPQIPAPERCCSYSKVHTQGAYGGKYQCI